MEGTTRQRVQGLPLGFGWDLGNMLEAWADRMGNHTISSAGLVIKAGGGVLVKAGAEFDTKLSDGKVGRIRTTAINTDMAALSGTVVNGTFNVFAFFIDFAGNLTSQMGIAGASMIAVKFPPIPKGKACIGYVRINPTGTGNFVGNTTALDNVTVVPNAVYRSIVGPFDPTLVA